MSHGGGRVAIAVAIASLVVGAGCGTDDPPGAVAAVTDGAVAGAAADAGTGIVFRDVTAESGVDFVHWAGRSERRYLPETMGAGVAIFDADGDRDADLFLVGGRDVASDRGASGAFYRNRGDGTFEEATAAAGLDDVFLGMGTAVGDVDGDRDLDLFVSAVALDASTSDGGDRLFRNRGDGTFEDVSRTAGLDDGGFSSSAAFLDADSDGDLDLFVGRYVDWSAADDVVCRPDGEHPSYCTPEVYRPVPSRLYRNRGDGTFEDWSGESGVAAHPGKALGVVPLGIGGEPALAVANDAVRNFLFVSTPEAGFAERAVESGLAYSFSGATRGAMGIDAGDVDGDGHEDLAIGNFAQEMSALYRGSAAGLFRDDAAQLGVGLPSLMPLAFGTLLVDLDLDGWLDLVFANGHIEPEIARFQPLQSHAQPPLALRNRDGQVFDPLPAAAALREPLVGRGLAAGDLDGDGDLDLVITQNGGPARLLRNETGGRSLRVALVGRGTDGDHDGDGDGGGVGSNTTGYGATVEVQVDGPDGTRQLRRRLVSGRSYLSSSEPVLTFGLGAGGKVTGVTVTWPSGRRQEVAPPYPEDLLTVHEE